MITKKKGDREWIKICENQAITNLAKTDAAVTTILFCV